MGEDIDDADELLRRVHPNNGPVWSHNDGRWIMSKAAFRSADPTRREVSVHATRLLPAGATPMDVAQRHPTHALATFTAGSARAVRFGIDHRPEQDAGPFASAHCNVTWPDAWSTRDFSEARASLLPAITIMFRPGGTGPPGTA